MRSPLSRADMALVSERERRGVQPGVKTQLTQKQARQMKNNLMGDARK